MPGEHGIEENREVLMQIPIAIAQFNRSQGYTSPIRLALLQSFRQYILYTTQFRDTIMVDLIRLPAAEPGSTIGSTIELLAQ
jgi:hypothetical protein